ncbi:MAG: alpha/beta hydrolase family protein [Candidatus Hodarchaeota archaeon]
MTFKKTKKPSIKEMGKIPSFGASSISPNGDKLFFTINYRNYKANQIDTFAYIYNLLNQKQYLFLKGSVMNVSWLDNETIALLKPTPKGNQLFLYEGLLGEGRQITDFDQGVSSFKKFNNGLLIVTKRKNPVLMERKEKYGDFIDDEQECEYYSSLFYLNLAKLKITEPTFSAAKMVQSRNSSYLIGLTSLFPDSFIFESLVPSPNNDTLYLNCLKTSEIIDSNDRSFFRIQFSDSFFETLDPQLLSSSVVVTQMALPKRASIEAISPNEMQLLISYKEGGHKTHIQEDLWLLNIQATEQHLDNVTALQDRLVCITKDLDRAAVYKQWTQFGLFVLYFNESTLEIAKISETGVVEVWDTKDLYPQFYFFLSDDGAIVFSGASRNTLIELYYGTPHVKGWNLTPITNINERFTDWDFGTVESIRWTSKDGTEIEGVLRKPSDFDSSQKYPLLFLVHGGPAWASQQIKFEREWYPWVQLLNKGILILQPNYRGSKGRGRKFLSLNHNNLGVGDMWDIESAIDHLAAKGFVDETRIGCMGFSQGGYISSFLAMHSNRFKAISAGAALCNWRTYYCGSDSRNYISIDGDPYTNSETFDKTAPISGIANANTPVLFQHGENDQRVPLISAKEMYRALKARGIETKLIIFKNLGHGITTLKEFYGMAVQNYRWFSHYLLGEDLDLFK